MCLEYRHHTFYVVFTKKIYEIFVASVASINSSSFIKFDTMINYRQTIKNWLCAECKMLLQKYTNTHMAYTCRHNGQLPSSRPFVFENGLTKWVKKKNGINFEHILCILYRCGERRALSVDMMLVEYWIFEGQ